MIFTSKTRPPSLTADGSLKRPFPAPLRIFVAITLSATAASWLVILIARLMELGYPYDWPTLNGYPLYDFYVYFKPFGQWLHHTEFFSTHYPFTYMPSGVLAYKAFFIFGVKLGLVVYFAVIFFSVSVGPTRLRTALLLRRYRPLLVDSLILLLPLASYPAMFCLQRGNLEFILAIGIGLGTWAFFTGRRTMAAVLWGICGTVKLYPLMLLAMFISTKQWRKLLVGIGAAFSTTLAAIFYVGPTFRQAAAGIHSSLGAFLGMYTLRYDPETIGLDHSLFALLKVCLRPFHAPLPTLLHWYLAVMGIVALGAYFLRVRKLPLTNQITFITVASILLPPTSIDYTLLQLYAPLAALILFARDSTASRLAMSLFALLLTPTNFLFIHGEGMAGQIKAVLLLALVTTAAGYPLELPTSKAADEGHSMADLVAIHP